jgi:hypothetical protein
MSGEMEILKQAFIPEEGPKWGTAPATDLPGEAHPEGLDENKPVGDDAQNTRHLMANFNSAPATEAQMHAELGTRFAHFAEGSRVSSNQLLKQQPSKTNARVYGIMSEALRRSLSAA